MRSKYHNQKTEFDGFRFDSKKEAKRWWELKMMERAGLIKDLCRQFPIKLLPAQKDERGKVIERPVQYIADFIYEDVQTGERVVEDAKGVRTAEYIIKRKLLLYMYGIKIREV